MTPFRTSGTALRAVATLTTAGLMTLGFSGSAIAEDFKVGIVSFSPVRPPTVLVCPP